MSDDSLEEIKGRLFLWYAAIEQCASLIKLSTNAQKSLENSKQTNTTNSFPSADECKLIHHAGIELAIIYFCQITTSGYEDKPKVSGNNKKFREKHWNAIVSRAINPEETDQFNLLLGEIENARHQMLAHAQGTAFEVQHHGPITEFKQFKQSWSNIDLPYWLKTVDILRNAIGNYIRDLSKKQS